MSGRRTWAEGLGPDGICIDSDGGIWCQTADTHAHNESGPAGGPEGRHLFLLCNEFEGIDQLESVLARRSARIYVTEIPV